MQEMKFVDFRSHYSQLMHISRSTRTQSNQPLFLINQWNPPKESTRLQFGIIVFDITSQKVFAVTSEILADYVVLFLFVGLIMFA